MDETLCQQTDKIDKAYCFFALNLISFYKSFLQIQPFIKREKFKRGKGQ